MQQGLRGLDHNTPLSSLQFNKPVVLGGTRAACKVRRQSRGLHSSVQAQHRRSNNGNWREHTDKALQQASDLWNAAWDQFDSAVMPRERGDIRDQFLMALSIAIFVLFSMQLYRIYLHLYYAAGFRPLLRPR